MERYHLTRAKMNDHVRVAVVYRDSDPLVSIDESLIMDDWARCLRGMNADVVEDRPAGDVDRSDVDLVLYRGHSISKDDGIASRLSAYDAPVIRMIDSVAASRRPEHIDIDRPGLTISAYDMSDDHAFSGGIIGGLECVSSLNIPVSRHSLDLRLGDRVLVIDLLGDLDPQMVGMIDEYASTIDVDVLSKRSWTMRNARAIEGIDPFTAIGSYRYCMIMSNHSMNTINSWAAITQNTFILTPWDHRGATFMSTPHYFRGLMDIMDVMEQSPDDWKSAIMIQRNLGLNLRGSRANRKRRLLYRAIGELTGLR